MKVVSLPTLITVVLIVLKLTGVIHWSWVLVLLPVLFGPMLLAAILAVCFLSIFFGGLIWWLSR